MEIKIRHLLKIIDILKTSIVENMPNEITVESEEFYWQIPNEKLYNPEEKPVDLHLGQLSEDWEELSRLMDKNEIPISYDLSRLSVILEIIRKNSVGKW